MVGKQLAAAEAQHTVTNVFNDQSTALSREDTLALEALRLANGRADEPEQIVKRAQQYLEFLKGKDNG